MPSPASTVPSPSTGDEPPQTPWPAAIAGAWIGGLAFAAADGVASAIADVDRTGSRLGVALGLTAFGAPWFAACATPLAPVLRSVVRRARAPRNADPSRRDGLVALPAALGVLAGLAYRGALLASDAEDRDLGAVLFAAGFAVLGAGAWVAHAALVTAFTRLARRLSDRPRLALAAKIAVSVSIAALAMGGPILDNAGALATLGASWAAAPLAAAGGAVLVAVTPRVPPVGRRHLAGAAALLVGGAAAVGTAWGDLPRAAIAGRAWSSELVELLRAVTDVDRDGHSSLLAGGDCAPFDETVGPGARDVPDDGIDQNCNGEDASSATAATPPRWFDDRLGLPLAKNAVVITVEALRADRTSLHGHHRDTTPELQALAAGPTTVFERTYSATSSTRLTIAALWSSRPPSTLPWVRAGRARVPIFDETAPWIPSFLSEAGLETIAVLPRWVGVLPREKRGYDRGFAVYDVSTPITVRKGEFHGTSAGKIVDRALELVARRSRDRFFLWVHLVEPHARYERHPGSPDFGDADLDRYDTEIWGVDREIGRLVRTLDERALLSDTVVVVTGDHAEAFGEHGVATHATTVYDAETRTVGLLRVPGTEPRRVSEPMVHHDLGPTLMNLLGVRRGFDGLRGRNLVPALVGRPLERPSFVVEIFHSEHHRKYWAALVQGPFKLVYREDTREYRLFDVVADAAEKHDLSGERPEAFDDMRRNLVRFIDAESRRVPVERRRPQRGHAPSGDARGAGAPADDGDRGR